MKFLFPFLFLFPGLSSATSLDVQGVVFKPGLPYPGECLEQSVEDGEVGLERLTKTLQIMMEYPDLTYEVVGRSDVEECRVDECQLISKRRAEIVVKFFVDAGVDPARLQESRGVGVDMPFGVPGSPSNRSAEINITN